MQRLSIYRLHAIQKPRHILTVHALMNEWLTRNRNHIKNSTYQKYTGIVQNHIKDSIGSLPVGMLTSTQLEQFTDECLHHGNAKNQGGLSRKTVNDILIVLRMALQFATAEHHIPCPKIRLLKDKQRKMRVLDSAEQKLLENYLSADMDIYKFGILLSLYSGMRIGELCALQWEDIRNATVTINKTMQRQKGQDGKTHIVITSPKSESSNRMIPVPKCMLPIIESFRQPSGHILAHTNGKYIEPRLMQIKFEKIIAQAGLEKANFHALRHTFATRCVEAGFELKSLSEILGHADVKTTLNRYVHSSFALKQLNMNRLNDIAHIGYAQAEN